MNGYSFRPEIKRLRAIIAQKKRTGMNFDAEKDDLQKVYAARKERRYFFKSLRVERKRKEKGKAVAVRTTQSAVYKYRESDTVKIKAFYQTREWKFMRYEALRRHGARCQCCGAGQENGGIHVDHIQGLRVAWDLRLDIENLQVLCGDCNEGKGARHSDDWRPAA